jgi:hypothetical protein
VEPQLRDVDQPPRQQRLVAVRRQLLGEAPRRHHREHRRQLRSAQVGLDQQHLGAIALGQRQRQVDRGRGLAVAGGRAGHHDHLRPAGREHVVAQHAELRGALGVGREVEDQPVVRLAVLGEVVLGQPDLGRLLIDRRRGALAEHRRHAGRLDHRRARDVDGVGQAARLDAVGAHRHHRLRGERHRRHRAGRDLERVLSPGAIAELAALHHADCQRSTGGRTAVTPCPAATAAAPARAG